MKIKPIKFNNLPKTEGLVLLGASGDPQEWIKGTSELLKNEKIAKSSPWAKAFVLTTTGGRTDLLLIWKKNALDIGKLALWRLRFGDCSWLSDYVINYRNHH